MFEKLELTRMAQGMAAHAGARLALVAENIANADTPGFKARDLPAFAEVFADSGAALRRTRQGHLADTEGRHHGAPVLVRGSAAPNGNTVSLELEMVRSVDVRQQHDLALAISRATSDVIRASLGRAR
jgi:flagellar basal-body rod protein FlgB